MNGMYMQTTCGMLHTANMMLITVSIWMTLRSLFDIKRDFLLASPDFRSFETTFGKSSGRKIDGRRAPTLLVASTFLNVQAHNFVEEMVAMRGERYSK